MIVSAIEGRIRVVEPVLKNRLKADAVAKGLEKVTGVTGTTINQSIGSLLVCYDSSVTGSRSIRRQINRLMRGTRPAGVTALVGPRPRRYVKYGLLGSVTGTTLFLFMRTETWHFRAGSVFLLLLSLHLFQNRRRLLK